MATMTKLQKTLTGFPEVSDLWRGAVLASVVHAVMNVRYFMLSNEHSWDGRNYSIQDSQGGQGTITFAGEDVVGAFFSKDSPRSPFGCEGCYELEPRLVGMPFHIREIALQETFQYLLDDYDGATVPIVTAVFWSEDGRLTSNEAWKDVLTNGGDLISSHSLDVDSALEEMKDGYEMTQAETLLARRLFLRRLMNLSGSIYVEETELASITAGAEPEGIAECINSLKEMNILLKA